MYIIHILLVPLFKHFLTRHMDYQSSIIYHQKPEMMFNVQNFNDKNIDE